MLAWYGPPGTDLAAHLYQRAFFLRDGFSLWNNYWYAGRYSFVTYSLFYYPLAAVTGINLLATASVAIGAFAFGLVVEREWGRAARRTSWLFALALAASVLSAAFPYMLGTAFALVALAVRSSHTTTSLFAASAGDRNVRGESTRVSLARRGARGGADALPADPPQRAVLPVVSTALAGAALWRLFPGERTLSRSRSDELAAALLFCAAGLACTWRVERARLLFNFFAIYAATCLLCYLIPSDVGANIVRVRFAAFPIAALALSLRRWKPLLPATAALGLALAWNVTPLASSFERGASDPSSTHSYWTPAIRFLHSKLAPSYRVEAVDTVGHWEADYLPAAGIPLVRGWFRQDDFPQNAVLYQPARPQGLPALAARDGSAIRRVDGRSDRLQLARLRLACSGAGDPGSRSPSGAARSRSMRFRRLARLSPARDTHGCWRCEAQAS